MYLLQTPPTLLTSNSTHVIGEDPPPIPDTIAVEMCNPRLLLHRSRPWEGHRVGRHRDSDYTQEYAHIQLSDCGVSVNE